jgi:hypothetical protein
VRITPDEYGDGLLLYGDLVNETGTSQEPLFVNATFYDGEGQIVADDTDAYGYWPVLVLAPGGRTPFELIVEGIQSAANYELSVDAQPSGEVPRRDFEFSDLHEFEDEYGYCIGGTLRNPGSQLGDYLLVVATLYDDQGRVINFDEYYAAPEYVVGDQVEEFEVCPETYEKGIARYDLQAWGR